MFDVSPQPAGLESVRLIASDMDNTLLDEHGELPEGIYERVLELEELGVTFAIASGRPLVTLRELFPRLRSRIMLIGDNGGVIANRDEVIYEADLPSEAYKPMVEMAMGRGDCCMLCATDTVYFNEADRRYDDVYATFYYNRTYVPSLRDIAPKADKFTIYLPKGDSVARVGDVYGPAFGSDYTVASAGDVWVDVTPRGMDKGAAMRHAGELLGIDTAEMMAFGDTFNDAAMLDTVGFSYMVANATPGMEEHARYVAPSNADHGVLTVIDQVIAAKRAAR